MAGLAALLFVRLPSAFLPQEDQGWMMAQVMTPPGATQQRTMNSIRAVEKYFLENEKDAIRSIFTVQGSLIGLAGLGLRAGLEQFFDLHGHLPSVRVWERACPHGLSRPEGAR